MSGIFTVEAPCVLSTLEFRLSKKNSKVDKMHDATTVKIPGRVDTLTQRVTCLEGTVSSLGLILSQFASTSVMGHHHSNSVSVATAETDPRQPVPDAIAAVPIKETGTMTSNTSRPHSRAVAALPRLVAPSGPP